MSAVEKFPILLSEAEEESSSVPPCFSDEGINVRTSAIHVHTYSNTKSVPLHQTQQPLPPSSHKTKHQCRRDPTLSSQGRRGLHGILQSAGGRINTRQLRDHL